jgi:hypothetical protein
MQDGSQRDLDSSLMRYRLRVVRGIRNLLGLGAVIAAGSSCGSSTAVASGSDASIDAIVDSGDDSQDSSEPVAEPGPCGFPFGFCPSDAAGPTCPVGSPLSCYVNKNCTGTQTTITGKVYDPAGKNPVPGVIVYVPNDPTTLPKPSPGTSTCSLCTTPTADFVTFAISNDDGSFDLKEAPTGTNIPLVIQTGKWRRIIAVRRTDDCGTVALADGTARLPRNRREGDLPQMAVLTGGCDGMACFLRNVGVDESEFTAPHAGGRVDVYQGLAATGAAAGLSNGTAGDCTTASCPLWSSKQSFEAYDDVFLGCECDEHNETKPPTSMQALHDWVAEGGIVFATHSQATWFKNGPPDVQSIANWVSGPASGVAGPFAIDRTSIQGDLFWKWLSAIGALDANGFVPLDPATVSTSVAGVDSGATTWLYDSLTVPDGGRPGSGNVKAFSLPTTITPADVASPVRPCGEIHVTDIHVGDAPQDAGSEASSASLPVPAACSIRPLNAGEKVLEYLLFGQTASCVVSGPVRPVPPPSED